MRTTGRPPTARKTPQATPSPTKSGVYIHPQLQQHTLVDPATMQAYAYMQPPPGWPGMDAARLAYPPGSFAQLPPGVPIPPMGYPGIPPAMTAQQFQAQQALVLQAQLAQLGYGPPAQFQQLAPPPVEVIPELPERDPFVYVQPEVSEAVDAELMETIRKRALFVAPPMGRIRIPQACERCRKRKTKCTGEKPQCKRCQKRGFECEYVWEHRANKTKKAVAEREQAGSEAAEYGQAYPGIVAPVPVRARPPMAHAFSSSSGYSAGSASSLPPPLMFAGHPGQLYLAPVPPPLGAPAGYLVNSGPSALPTPTIMVDGCPISAGKAPAKAPTAAAARAARSRSGTRSIKPTPSNSVQDLQAMSRSTSTMSMQYPDLPAPWPSPSTSCQGCISEMTNCAGCTTDHEVMHGAPHQRTDGMHACGSMPNVDALMHGPPPPSPPPAVKQHLLDALNKVLARQATEQGYSVSPDDRRLEAMSAVPPLASRGGSSSSSGGSNQSGVRTPYDYFNLPGSAGMSSSPSPSTISPGMLNLTMRSPAEGMMPNGGDGYRGAYAPTEAFVHQVYQCAREEEAESMQFSDYFHAFSDGSTPGSM
ncbi:hypothetical protein C2E23DRAFT_380001 [Lenzites betulinus]|nr:hypothetical protein C2E23DRAFT_380001 [Lenzites betulinus]